jgi:hypothetical protein
MIFALSDMSYQTIPDFALMQLVLNKEKPKEDKSRDTNVCCRAARGLSDEMRSFLYAFTAKRSVDRQLMLEQLDTRPFLSMHVRVRVLSPPPLDAFFILPAHKR